MGKRSDQLSSRTSYQPINGYNLVGWSENDVTYWATSDLNTAELETFAKLFKTAPVTR